MINENQSELIARAEEVLRGLKKEEEDIKMLEAVEATARLELQADAMAWEVAEVALEMRENEECELAGLAMSSCPPVACATVPLATLVAEQHTCP